MKFKLKFNDKVHFYGKACGNGHIGIRYISTGICVECLKSYDRKGYYKRYNQENRRTPKLFASKLLHSCKARSREKQWEFGLTLDWIKEKLENGICEVTGVSLDFTKSEAFHVSPFSPSIDRIDSSKPYIPENCRVVCMIYNVCKGQWQDSDVLNFARLLTNVSDKKPL